MWKNTDYTALCTLTREVGYTVARCGACWPQVHIHIQEVFISGPSYLISPVQIGCKEMSWEVNVASMMLTITHQVLTGLLKYGSYTIYIFYDSLAKMFLMLQQAICETVNIFQSYLV